MYIKPAKLFPNSPISYFSPAGRSVIEILSYLDQNGQNISFNFHHKISKNMINLVNLYQADTYI